ncbi:MAG: TadE/TadG family type IV pilus assembly protein [Solirubrobacterales bacterium]
MSRQVASSRRREDGTASVELIGVVPFLLLAILVAAQIGLAGYALWSAGSAARAGARAALIGREADVVARRALPDSMRASAAITDDTDITVQVEVPRLVPGMPRLRLAAHATLGTDDG